MESGACFDTENVSVSFSVVVSTSQDSWQRLPLQRSPRRRLELRTSSSAKCLEKDLLETFVNCPFYTTNGSLFQWLALILIAMILTNALQVLLCTHKVSGDRFAAKKIEKQHLIKTGNTKYAVSEREVLTTCQHPNIIKLFYSFRDDTCLCTRSATRSIWIIFGSFAFFRLRTLITDPLILPIRLHPRTRS